MRWENGLFLGKRFLASAIVLIGAFVNASQGVGSRNAFSAEDQDDELILTFGEEQQESERARGNSVDSLNFTSWESPRFVEKIRYNGYANGGIYANTFGADYNGGINSGSESGLSLNGAYIAVLKETETSESGFDWGFGVDFMFGEDSRFLRVEHGLDEKWDTGHNRFGDPTYGFAMPQLYGKVAWNNWSFTAGHIYAPFGYESCRADERFFYSTGLSFDALPATMMGGLLTYSGIENLEASVGLVNGADQGFSGTAGGSLLAGSAVWTPMEESSLTYSVGVGDFVDRRWRKTSGNLHSLVFEIQADFQWKFAATLDYENVDDGTGTDVDLTIVGYHVYYTLDPNWKFGTRVEWSRNKTTGATAVNQLGWTVGAAWTPDKIERLSVRPELRTDASDSKMFGTAYNKKVQLCLGVDALYSF